MTDSEVKAMDEIYAEIDEEAKRKEAMLTELNAERYAITALLNSYGVPTLTNGRPATLLERIDMAMRGKMYA